MSFTNYKGFTKVNLEKQILEDLHKFDWEAIKKELEQEEKDAREHYRKREQKVSGWEPAASQQRFLAFDLEAVGSTLSSTGVWFSNTTTGPIARQETPQEDVEDVAFED